MKFRRPPLGIGSYLIVLTTGFILLSSCVAANAQSTASIEGRVLDQNGSAIPAVEIKALSRAIVVERTDGLGRYEITALPVGDYRIEVRPPFGRITHTRFPTGDSGSSRLVQFAAKLTF